MWICTRIKLCLRSIGYYSHLIPEAARLTNEQKPQNRTQKIMYEDIMITQFVQVYYKQIDEGSFMFIN